MVPAVEVRGLSKSYPGVRALDDVSLSVATGSCHALVGENGAGKSTLAKILAGLIQPSSGSVFLFGSEVRFGSPLEALKAGVAIVHQELVAFDNMTVEENLAMEEMPARGPFVDFGAVRAQALDWLSAVHASVDPSALFGSLSTSHQQLVLIAGAVARGARVVIFDEATSSLSQREAEILFEQIARLRAAGVTCIYVSHRMDEIFRLCDTVSVLRDGRHVATGAVAASSERGTRNSELGADGSAVHPPVEQKESTHPYPYPSAPPPSAQGGGALTRDQVVSLMIGRELEAVSFEAPTLGEVALEVNGLSSPGRFSGISFQLHRGEVLGVAGLVGSGRSEVAEAIFGLDRAVRGTVKLHGREIRVVSPDQMLSLGVGLVPEDRKRQGLVLTMNARENITLPSLPGLSRGGFVRAGRERQLATAQFEALRVRAPGLDSDPQTLSGGNQQKLVLAKWLAAQCDVLMLDEPTRGVDVGAKAEIHTLIRALAQEGRAVLVISSELPELLSLCTRTLVMREGRIVGEVEASEATEEGLLRLMTGTSDVAG